MTIAYSGDSITYPDLTVQATAPKVGMVNRIINGAMRIDQRNAGASVSFAASASGYTLDRFLVENSTDGALTVQRSTTAPAGFTNSCLITVTTADASLAATQRCRILQAIEGFNSADLAFGSASASAVTLSFWVRSSLTGTFGGALNNGDVNRSYPFTYTIAAANTWERITITVAGETTGTWNTGNTVGMYVQFGLGVGSTYSGTANVWGTSQLMSATGAVSVVGTSGATFYITGVQLEKGSTATSFDYRPYGTELQLCQRYYFKVVDTTANARFGNGVSISTTQGRTFVNFPVAMRVRPTSLDQTGTAADYRVFTASFIVCSAVPAMDTSSIYGATVTPTVSSGLVAGAVHQLGAANVGAFLGFPAEL